VCRDALDTGHVGVRWDEDVDPVARDDTEAEQYGGGVKRDERFRRKDQTQRGEPLQ
jgi:hypothetical protein